MQNNRNFNLVHTVVSLFSGLGMYYLTTFTFIAGTIWAVMMALLATLYTGTILQLYEWESWK